MLTLPAWTIGMPLAASLAASALILDANWMAAVVRKGVHASNPPLFRSPFKIKDRWRHAAMLLLLILCIFPMMMEGPTGVRRFLSPSSTAWILLGLVISVALTCVAEVRGWRAASNLAASVTAGLLLAPYALTGAAGVSRYLIIVGMLLSILLSLFLAATLHKVLLSSKPRSRLGALVRLIADVGSAGALMAAAFWL